MSKSIAPGAMKRDRTGYKFDACAVPVKTKGFAPIGYMRSHTIPLKKRQVGSHQRQVAFFFIPNTHIIFFFNVFSEHPEFTDEAFESEKSDSEGENTTESPNIAQNGSSQCDQRYYLQTHSFHNICNISARSSVKECKTLTLSGRTSIRFYSMLSYTSTLNLIFVLFVPY